ncbi:3-dehydroquinate synthase [Portibacter marinus]|uniref:3-dehydroquinate synthase n=1 Tax=Portibacter marinus TaxID=2898660 RepID=UPI001F305928|nr:3-dehydroquinate synthase [Portibacter marinus]
MSSVNCGSYLIYVNEKWNGLGRLINGGAYSKIGVLVDENTKLHCLPYLRHKLTGLKFDLFEIPSGEKEKTLQTCQFIWNNMLQNGFDRHSLMINLGGGVIGDMGGFCARTFMRGMDFIQIPTTLLSQVDASVGGKLGVDFQNYKNLIGVIDDPVAVWIDDQFLDTLPARELRSGFAEIIKHALISDRSMWEDIQEIEQLESVNWGPIIERSVKIKRDVVIQDKREGGLRKILNFGHTLGHAIESENLHSDKPLLHGEAISVGMITEAYISKEMLDLSDSDYIDIKNYILKIYPHFSSQLEKEAAILDNLLKDKKNRRGMVHFSLLNQIGDCIYDIVPEKSTIIKSLEDYRKS